MASLDPIPERFLKKPAQMRSDSWDSWPRNMLQAVHDLTQTGKHQNSWGITIYRTVYTKESDAGFALAVERIEGYMRRWVTTKMDYIPSGNMSHGFAQQAGEEMLCRLRNTVIEDRENLDGAPLSVIAAAFDKWVEENGDPESISSRYHIALIVDEESLEKFQQLPAPFTPGLFSRDRVGVCCKAYTRICIHLDLEIQWFRAAPALIPLLYFEAQDKDTAAEVFEMMTQVNTDPIEMEMLSPLNRYSRKRRHGE